MPFINNANQMISIFPNPASQFIEVHYENSPSSGTTILITDLIGRTFTIPFQYHHWGIRMNTSELSDGVYFLQVIQSDKQSVTKFEVIH